MRALVILLTASTTLLAGACAYLLWHAGDERPLVVSHDGRALQDQIDSLVAERERLRREVELARRSATCAPAPSTGPSRSFNVAGNAAIPFASARSGPGFALFDRLTPEQRRTMVRERYGTLLYKEMSLSSAQVEALLPVLVEQDEVKGSPRESFGPRDTPEARAREREIAAVIGTEKAAQFAELRSTIPTRAEVRRMREDLERAGAALSDEQNAALMTAMKDLPMSQPPQPAPSATPQESMEQFRAWRAEQAKQIRDRAASVLTPPQIQRLDERDSLRAAMSSMPLMPVPPNGNASPAAPRGDGAPSSR